MSRGATPSSASQSLGTVAAPTIGDGQSLSQIGNSELISAVNSRLVLHAVRVMQPTFRAAVARHTGLKPASVTSIVNDLISQRILREVRRAPAAIEPRDGEGRTHRWGRPPLMLEVDSGVKRILAVDLEPDRIRVALTNLVLEVLSYREKPIDRFSKPAAVCREIIRLCSEVREGVGRGQLLGVGVSLPGLIDATNGTLISSTNMPNWHDVPIGPKLREGLNADVRVGRSMHLSALYEKWADPRQDDRTVLILSLRTGVGMSLIHRGELYTGKSGFDGEIGHTIVDLRGPACECGSRGCLETFVSASAICRHAQARMQNGSCAALAARLAVGEPLSPELIYRLAHDGDDDCANIVRHIGRYLGIAAANLMNLFAPDEVVISGSIDTAGEILIEAIRAEVEQAALPRTRQRVLLRLAKERERLPLLGAAVLVAQDLFELPKLRHGTLASGQASNGSDGDGEPRGRRSRSR